MKNKDGEEITVEDALDDIEGTIERIKKFLTYPEQWQKRKEILRSLCNEMRNEVDMLKEVFEEQ